MKHELSEDSQTKNVFYLIQKCPVQDQSVKKKCRVHSGYYFRVEQENHGLSLTCQNWSAAEIFNGNPFHE